MLLLERIYRQPNEYPTADGRPDNGGEHLLFGGAGEDHATMIAGLSFAR